MSTARKACGRASRLWGASRLWQVVYIAPNENSGAVVKDLLTKKGFLVMTRAAGMLHPGHGAPHEILVPAVEAAEAHEILTGVLSSGPLRPRS